MAKISIIDEIVRSHSENDVLKWAVQRLKTIATFDEPDKSNRIMPRDLYEVTSMLESLLKRKGGGNGPTVI